MKKPIVYIAGPYTKPDPYTNTISAVLLGQMLRDTLDVLTFVPHFTHYENEISPQDYEYWMALDFEWLRHCHAVFRMPGESSGADREVVFAKELGIPVFETNAALVNWTTAYWAAVAD